MSILPSKERFSIKPKNLNLFWLKSFHEISIIPCIFVNLLIPSSHPDFTEVWQKIDKIFNLLITFVHPSNMGSWTSNILIFLNIFIKFYVRRNVYEVGQMKKINKKKA
jgi:hypothetical protein